MKQPCGPRLAAPPRPPRRHSSCKVCQLEDGDFVTLCIPNGVPVTGPIADLSPAGVTLALADHLQFFPWTSITCMDWEPVQVPDRA